MGSLYCRTADILQPTWTLTAGTANSAFPVTNLGNLKPFNAFKSTGTSATMTGTFGGAKTLQAIALFMHNLPGLTITITNGAGLSTTLAIPANTADGLPVNVWKDLRAVANPTSTTWNIAVTGATGYVAVGEIFLIETVRTLEGKWGQTRGRWHPIDEEVTEKEVPLIYELGVRGRAFSAQVVKESERLSMEGLFDSARGRARAWWLVPDDTVNDCLYARFVRRMATSPGFAERLDYPHVTRMTVDVEEVGLGPAHS